MKVPTLYTLYPKPYTRNPTPETRNPYPCDKIHGISAQRTRRQGVLTPIKGHAHVWKE